ncbi:hypothetical protein Tsubulata_051044, partial [Turnera subulata]
GIASVPGCKSQATKVEILKNISGIIKPSRMTLLLGPPGCGKTTLLKALAGKLDQSLKVTGEITYNGHKFNEFVPQKTSAYISQYDQHISEMTVRETLDFSARCQGIGDRADIMEEICRKEKQAGIIPEPDIDTYMKEFVAEVLEMIELDDIKDALVGVLGVSGISSEQRKRLTIAVELVSNPAVIFMDEPTTGLDARAAAIVMRVVKNIVKTNRTIVCTIHQPSIDVFEAFDELILLKRGGQVIYYGELGLHSSKLIEYFESIPGVPKIKENYNPATWMLDVTSPSSEAQLGLEFAHLYQQSHLFQENEELVKRLRIPPEGSKEIQFPTRFPQNGWQQFKACLWKQSLAYWRSPNYNLARLAFVTASSLIFGVLLWQKGQKIEDEEDLLDVLGPVFIVIQFTGMVNCSSVLPFVASERIVVYRERFVGMYSSWAYSIAQVVVEIPYLFLQAAVFLAITYPAMNLYWSFYKAFWYFYSMFSTLLCFNCMGLLLASLTPTFQVASIFASFCYNLTNLFSGFVIPGPLMPKWWVWLYWICPTAWSLRGLFASQYGDIEKEITAFGERKAINAFLKSYFGYHQGELGVVAVVLLVFPLLFAVSFAIAIAKLNFQKT